MESYFSELNSYFASNHKWFILRMIEFHFSSVYELVGINVKLHPAKYGYKKMDHDTKFQHTFFLFVR